MIIRQTSELAWVTEKWDPSPSFTQSYSRHGDTFDKPGAHDTVVVSCLWHSVSIFWTNQLAIRIPFSCYSLYPSAICPRECLPLPSFQAIMEKLGEFDSLPAERIEIDLISHINSRYQESIHHSLQFENITLIQLRQFAPRPVIRNKDQSDMTIFL